MASLTGLALVAAACSSDSGGGDSAETSIVVGAEELPTSLNMAHLDGATAWSAWITQPVLARGYRVTPDFQYEPWVFEDDCTVESDEPFAIACSVRDDAAWSDGTTISAEDFHFTYESMVDPENEVWSTFGYEHVTDFDVTDDKSFTVTFDAPYPAYRDLWASGTMLLPEHLLAGEDFNTVWSECICDPGSGDPVGSGPYLVESFDIDEQVTLVRNADYWDGEAKTDRVVFVAMPETDTQVNALAGNDADVIYPQETTDIRGRIEAIDGASFDTALGFSFEQLSLLTTAPGLEDVEVRKAIATALPRSDVLDTVVQPVNDQAAVLDNSIYMTSQAEYVPNWDVYPAAGDPAAAEAILDAAGWVREGDGVRARDGVELSFVFGTTAGDSGRALAQQIIQERLGDIGIALEIESSESFFDGVDAFEYPFALYAFEATPDPASWVFDVYGTDATLNGTLQSNEQVDALLEQASVEIDADARAAFLNSADRVMATDVVSVIPLYQKPAVLGSRNVSGLVLNVTLEGFTWNIEDWERTG